MLKKLTVIILVMAVLIAQDAVNFGSEISAENLINITQGSSRLVKMEFEVRNIAVGNPEVADVLLVSAKEILVNAKKNGITTLTLWDNAKNYDYAIVVNKGSDNTHIKVFKLQNISLVSNTIENPDKMNVVKSEPVKETIEDLKTVIGSFLDATRFSVSPWTNSIMTVVTDKEEKMLTEIIKSLDIKEKQVLIQAEVYELKVTNSLGKELRMMYNKDDSQQVDKYYSNVSAEFSKDAGAGYTYNTNGYTAGGAVAEYTTHVLKMLEIEGKAKILANPKILTLNGKYSFIHAGEKIPVEKKDNNGQVTVEYIPIGVILGVVPRLDDAGNINCWLSTQVSSLSGYDPKNNNPIIGSRETTNEVRLKDGETLILGGLLQETENKSKRKVPILGDLLGWIPVIGGFFNNETSEKVQTELVITLKPQIVLEPVALAQEGAVK